MVWIVCTVLKKKKVVLTHSSILILCILSRLFRLGYTTVLKLSIFLGLSTYTSEEQIWAHWYKKMEHFFFFSQTLAPTVKDDQKLYSFLSLLKWDKIILFRLISKRHPFITSYLET